MRRHVERDNLIVLATLVKLSGSMALMTVQNKETVGPSCSTLCMLIEVLNTGKSKLICSPAILAYSNCPITWEVVVGVPCREVVLPR